MMCLLEVQTTLKENIMFKAIKADPFFAAVVIGFASVITLAGVGIVSFAQIALSL